MMTVQHKSLPHTQKVKRVDDGSTTQISSTTKMEELMTKYTNRNLLSNSKAKELMMDLLYLQPSPQRSVIAK